MKYNKEIELSGYGKLPPAAVDLEEAVLGALMLEKEALASVIDKLKPENFYKDVHQKIFATVYRLYARNEPTDYLTVIHELKKTGELEEIGGPYYITQLTAKVASTANTEYHTHIILQKFIQRELIRISSGIIEDAFEDTTDVLELLDKAEADIFGISTFQSNKNAFELKNLIVEQIAEIEKINERQDKLTGVPSGFTELDRITNGWQKSDLIILASRPAMGKSAAAWCMAINAAKISGKKTAFFSLEMSKEQLTRRHISIETGI